MRLVKILKTKNWYLLILKYLAVLLTALSVILIGFSLFESFKYEWAMPSSKSLAVFLSPQEKFYAIYAGWITIIAGYLALKTICKLEYTKCHSLLLRKGYSESE